MSSTSTRQHLWVLLAAVAVVACSVVVTLYASGVRLGGATASQGEGYQNVTLTDAVLTCRKSTESQFRHQIKVLTTDNHSSFLDQKRFVYKIFLEMDLEGEEGVKSQLNYINCFVSPSSGKITKYEVLVEEENGDKAAREDVNIFGIPKRN